MKPTTRTNLAVVLNSINDIRLEERKIPQPGPKDVLVAIKTVGICGSDVHYWTHGRIGDFIVKSPMVLGHESSGVVEEIGSAVTDLKKGDRITLEPGVPCRSCFFCKEGKYNLCPDMKFFATPPVDGSLANYITHPSDFCYKLPENVSFDEGALCEPLSVGIHACTRAHVSLGSHVLITGAGPIGLMCMLAAKAAGATTIVLVDIKEERLKVAKELGATATINATTDVASELKNLGHGLIDIAIECSGAESAVRTAIKTTKPGGVVVLVGLGPPEIKIPIVDAAVREVDIRGIFRYANCYPKALDLIASGQINVKPLITHTYDLKDVVKAFEVARDMVGGAIKVCIKVNP